jgi:transcriptional regulator with XRE-family HTH domain
LTAGTDSAYIAPVPKQKVINSPLRNMRRARTLTQAELGLVVGVTQKTISQAESGKLRISFDLQARIAAVLGASVDVLFPDREAIA